MIRAVLFDAAGTLIELNEPVGTSYARTADAHGIALDAQRVDTAFRAAFAEAPPLLFPGAEGAELDALERGWWRDIVYTTFVGAAGDPDGGDFAACFDALYRGFASPESWRCAPGCLETLATLRAGGLLCGVVSNFDRRLHALLSGLGIAPHLELVVLPSDAGAAKPDPRIFQHALARLALEPQAAVFVGDDPRADVAGARAAGLHAIGIESPATLRELPNHLAALQDAQPRSAP